MARKLTLNLICFFLSSLIFISCYKSLGPTPPECLNSEISDSSDPVGQTCRKQTPTLEFNLCNFDSISLASADEYGEGHPYISFLKNYHLGVPIIHSFSMTDSFRFVMNLEHPENCLTESQVRELPIDDIEALRQILPPDGNPHDSHFSIQVRPASFKVSIWWSLKNKTKRDAIHWDFQDKVIASNSFSEDLFQSGEVEINFDALKTLRQAAVSSINLMSEDESNLARFHYQTVCRQAFVDKLKVPHSWLELLLPFQSAYAANALNYAYLIDMCNKYFLEPLGPFGNHTRTYKKDIDMLEGVVIGHAMSNITESTYAQSSFTIDLGGCIEDINDPFGCHDNDNPPLEDLDDSGSSEEETAPIIIKTLSPVGPGKIGSIE